MAVINLREFLGNLKREGGDAIGVLPVIQKKIALQALSGVVNRTPVDTGRARGNWQTTVGQPALGQVDGTDKDGSPTIEDGLSALVNLEPFDQVWITNNVPYIEALENGHSDQAPAGMLAVTVASIEQQYQVVE